MTSQPVLFSSLILYQMEDDRIRILYRFENERLLVATSRRSRIGRAEGGAK